MIGRHRLWRRKDVGSGRTRSLACGIRPRKGYLAQVDDPLLRVVQPEHPELTSQRPHGERRGLTRCQLYGLSR